MDVRNETLSLKEDSIEKSGLIPKRTDRNQFVLKSEKVLKRFLDILGGILRFIGINTINNCCVDSK